MKITIADVTKFLTILVEWGGILQVDEDYNVVQLDGEPVRLNAGGGELKGIRILHDKMRRADILTFNPLVEGKVGTVEAAWYTEHINEAMATVVKVTMEKVLEIGAHGEKVPARWGELVEAAGKDVDEKTLKEFNAIPLGRLLYYYYNQGERFGQLKSSIFDDDYMKQLGIRVKSRKALRDLFGHVVNSVNPDKHFRHTAKELRMPRIECLVNVLSLFSTAIAPTVELTFKNNIKVYAEELEEYSEALSQLRSKCTVFGPGTVDDKRNMAKEKLKPDDRAYSEDEPVEEVEDDTVYRGEPTERGRSSRGRSGRLIRAGRSGRPRASYRDIDDEPVVRAGSRRGGRRSAVYGDDDLYEDRASRRSTLARGSRRAVGRRTRREPRLPSGGPS